VKCDVCGSTATATGRTFIRREGIPAKMRPRKKYLLVVAWRCDADGSHVGGKPSGGVDETS